MSNQQPKQSKSVFQRNREEASEELANAFGSRAGKVTVVIVVTVIVGIIIWNTITGATA
ncbi:hypothetical protein [Agromyces subbeticus]|uniref:hypothetical protein n=1 Tax=Agromyces subbeticus TaxID=293890 RepID=UPI0003B50522|nr:hypothetical protein [Agromyces subbeticus]